MFATARIYVVVEWCSGEYVVSLAGVRDDTYR